MIADVIATLAAAIADAHSTWTVTRTYLAQAKPSQLTSPTVMIYPDGIEINRRDRATVLANYRINIAFQTTVTPTDTDAMDELVAEAEDLAYLIAATPHNGKRPSTVEIATLADPGHLADAHVFTAVIIATYPV